MRYHPRCAHHTSPWQVAPPPCARTAVLSSPHTCMRGSTASTGLGAQAGAEANPHLGALLGTTGASMDGWTGRNSCCKPNPATHRTSCVRSQRRPIVRCPPICAHSSAQVASGSTFHVQHDLGWKMFRPNSRTLRAWHALMDRAHCVSGLVNGSVLDRRNVAEVAGSATSTSNIANLTAETATMRRFRYNKF